MFLCAVVALGPGGVPARAAEATTSATINYVVDLAHSSVTFEVPATLHTVHGKGSAVTGEFSRPSVPVPGGFPVFGKIRIETRTLDTGNSSRDKRMHRETLSVDRYPVIQFVPTRVVGSIPSFEPGTTASFQLEGDLTIRETKRPITIDANAKFTETGIVVDGKTSLQFPDFGVPDPSNFFVHVKPTVTIGLHLEARSGS
jgi:polyisoprenoid-binding protein YceI